MEEVAATVLGLCAFSLSVLTISLTMLRLGIVPFRWAPNQPPDFSVVLVLVPWSIALLIGTGAADAYFTAGSFASDTPPVLLGALTALLLGFAASRPWLRAHRVLANYVRAREASKDG